MFRSLATRLTAAYVFAAIVLVLIVVAAVTTFSLSMFGISVREASAAVAREAPDAVRFEILRRGSLAAAAPDIAQNLSRPGLHVVVLGIKGKNRTFLAGTGPMGPDGRQGVFLGRTAGAIGAPGVRLAIREAAPGGGPPGPGPAAGGPPRGFERMRPYPLGLNFFLRLEPVSVDVPGGRISIFPDPDPLLRAINAFWLAMLPIGLFVVIAAYVLGRYITGQALRPLVETTASLNRFGNGDFTPRLVLTSDRNEIGELVKAYNAAAAQVSAAFEERRAAELQMRQFIADAGHELRTPLTVLMGFIDVLRKRAQHDPGISLRIYDTMLDESRRMKALIEKLSVLARLENPQVRELETVDLAQVAGEVVSALQALEAKPRIALRVDSGALVRGTESELHDALSNLVDNALKYAPGSPVDVRVRVQAGFGAIEVSDRGPGIALESQVQVFDRFYRGGERPDTEGFGLGLAIAKRAVERAGGRIELASTLGEGSRFTMYVPLATRGEGASLAV